MFKKRTRPASVRDKPAVEEQEAEEIEAGPSSQPEDGAEIEDAGRSIEELRLLRKLRKSQQGIDIEKLNRGEDKKKKGKRLEEEEGAAAKFGLGKLVLGKKGDDDALGEDGLKRLVRTNNFTQQTNALDVDKHMLAYIETELLKRRGGAVAEAAERARRGEAPIKDDYDPQAELFKIAEKYRIEQNPKVKKEDEEGNVTSSLGMLTSIPEVDLGMDNRLKNIEETEKAKREMMEHRKAQAVVKKKDEDADFASARFFRPQHRVASDVYIMEDAKREAAGLPPVQKPRYERQTETATDEVVYERFKKRMKK